MREGRVSCSQLSLTRVAGSETSVSAFEDAVFLKMDQKMAADNMLRQFYDLLDQT